MENDTPKASLRADNVVRRTLAVRLLEPEYAGYLTPSEFRHVRGSLKRDKKLRTKWGFKKGNRRLSEKKIRLVAMYGVEGQDMDLSDAEGLFPDSEEIAEES